MLQTLLVLLALQTPAIGSRGEPPGISDGCLIQALDGQLVFPAFVAHAHFVDIELRPLGAYSSIRETFTGAYESFHFYNVPSGAYNIDIQVAGMDLVHQFVVLLKDSCEPGPGAKVIIPMHASSAIKSSPIEEDAVSIKSLMRKTPNRTAEAFEKSLDKESKASPDDMAATLEGILKTAPDYYDANLELGLQFQKEDQRGESIAMLTHALEVNPASMIARTELGRYRFEAGEFQEAADLLGEAVRLGNTSPDVYFMLGSSYYKLGQLALAEASLRRTLDIDAGYGQAHLQLYNVYMQGNLPEKALAEVRAYLTNYPEAKDRIYVQGIVDKMVNERTSVASEPQSVGSTALLQPPQSTSPELDRQLNEVMQRATEYVTKYEAELGNLIGTEEYSQAATWLNTPTQVTVTGCASCPKIPLKTMTRHTSSDFMLIEVGPQWTALREVNTVDGNKVRSEEPPLDTAFDGSLASNTMRLNSMKADSTKYNIGDVIRQTNLPTFALQALRKDEAGRFSFEKVANEKIHGIPVWRVSFHEMRGPALVNASGGKDLYSTGTFWIEPETGKVIKTEFRVDNRFDKPAISSNIVVNYVEDKTRNILVPGTMTEHYETANNIIDCRAEYSKFHPFSVDVKFDIAPPKPAP